MTDFYKSEARSETDLRVLWRLVEPYGLPFEKWLDLRDRSRKDLFYLGKEVLGKDLYEHVHRPICDFFVRKNFDGVYSEKYSLGDVHRAIGRQDTVKERLLLYPRGSYKSTIDGIDCVQWIINVPDIRLLILTGEYKLAIAFMSEIKGYFWRRPHTDLTFFQALFPEFVIKGKDGESDEPLLTPARRHPQKEPTLWVNSLGSNLSGWHCDVKKGDDVVTDENSNTVDTRLKLKDKYDNASNLVDEWGFEDHIGTRYYPDDWYGTRLKEPQDESPIKYLLAAAWTPRAGFESIPLRDLKEEMVDLLFPEKLDFKSLRRKLLRNERQFRCQQLNDPSGSVSITFSEDSLRSAIIQPSGIPSEGEIYVSWDWAHTRTSRSDYSVGVCAKITKEGKIYIQEIVFDRWRPSELAFQIVDFARKWKPRTVLIEKSTGAELLQLEVQRQAVQRQVQMHIFWRPVKSTPDAKANQIRGIETLLNDQRIFFAPGWWIDETFAQFVDYTGERTNRGRKDDIPDAISMLQFFLPSPKRAETAEERSVREENEKREAMRAAYNHIFNPPAAPILADEEETGEPASSSLFGGNGMRGLNVGPARPPMTFKDLINASSTPTR